MKALPNRFVWSELRLWTALKRDSSSNPNYPPPTTRPSVELPCDPVLLCLYVYFLIVFFRFAAIKWITDVCHDAKRSGSRLNAVLIPSAIRRYLCPAEKAQRGLSINIWFEVYAANCYMHRDLKPQNCCWITTTTCLLRFWIIRNSVIPTIRTLAKCHLCIGLRTFAHKRKLDRAVYLCGRHVVSGCIFADCSWDALFVGAEVDFQRRRQAPKMETCMTKQIYLIAIGLDFQTRTVASICCQLPGLFDHVQKYVSLFWRLDHFSFSYNEVALLLSNGRNQLYTNMQSYFVMDIFRDWCCGFNLLSSLLHFDPQRITAADALRHPYFNSIRDKWSKKKAGDLSSNQKMNKRTTYACSNLTNDSAFMDLKAPKR